MIKQNRLNALKKMKELGFNSHNISSFGTPHILEKRIYTFSNLSKDFEAVYTHTTCFFQYVNGKEMENEIQINSESDLDFETLLTLSTLGIIEKEITFTTTKLLEI